MFAPALLALALTAPPTAAPGIAVSRDVAYATLPSGDKLYLDLARPAGPGPHPVVVCFHGGAWKYGSRHDLSRSALSGIDFTDSGGRSLLEVLAARGFAAASVGYRLAPKHKWPAPVEDAKTAVRFLRANAKTFALDPTRVAAMGFSAGGHLSALLGTTGKEAGLDGPLYPDESSAVSCVVDYFGPTDLTLYAESEGLEKAYMRPFLGVTFADRPDVYKLASPLTHAGKGAAPFLIVHGTADLIVPIVHSERLHAKLAAAGAECELLSVKGKGHGWTGQPAADAMAASVKFLEKHLKGAK